MKPKASHYETLGIKADASPEEIKRAYRKRATKEHPDKATGNHDAMSALAIAYGVLSDPERRANYDETGRDQLPRTEEHIASMVMQAFKDALLKSPDNILKNARKWLADYNSKLEEQKATIEEIITVLQDRRKKINTDNSTNFFHLIIDQSTKQHEQSLVNTEVDLNVCKIALQRLSEYKSDEPEPEPEQVNAVTYYTVKLS